MSLRIRRALVVRGGWEGHIPVEATDMFIPYLKEAGFDVTVEDSLESYADTEFMAGIDLIVQCWTMGEILPDEMRGLREAVAAGTGFAGWHGGIVDSFRMATDYLQMVGGQFAAHPGDLRPHTVEVVPEKADHPIVAGVGTIPLNSEQYWMLTDANSEVLATTTIHPTDGDPWTEPIVSPAVWTRPWGQGKVFVCTPGHQLADLATPAIRTIINRGMVWAAR
ncbi:ThuA domain-containing protein [Hamadaea tsunoensis]|uniref:ThuA domain-containing protein n=1 Tax=Hamadaea tsunoensis TaxID=53368 RepID=UPI0003FD5A1F|nr:ThuA domain-containing protein [Hamadaea tsunoensis]